MQITNTLTDEAAIAELGSRVARARLGRNLTQQQLADTAGVSVDTVRRLERGQSVTLTALLRLLRALGQLDAFDGLLADELPSPVEQLERERRRRRRASGGHGQRARKTGQAEPRGWEWSGQP